MKKAKEKTFELFSKYRTLLMGVATLSIFFFHFTEDCQIYNHGFDGFVKFYNTYIGSGGVDIFLMLSGLGLYYSWKKNPNYKEFIKKRLVRILLTYFLIATPAIIIRDIILLDRTWINVISDLFFVSLLKNGNRWHWYIFFISACYIIFPWLYDLIESKKKNISIEETLIQVVTSVTVLALVLYYFANRYFGNLNIMFLRIPIFIFGIYLGKLAYNKEKITNKWIFFVLLTIAMLPLRQFNKILLIRYILGMVCVSLVFIIVQIFESLEKREITLNPVRKFIEFFGKYSLELYLTHVTIRTFFNHFELYTYKVHFELLMLGISIVLSLIIHYIVEKIQTKFVRGYNKKV